MIKHITIKIDPPVLEPESKLVHYATTYEVRNKPIIDAANVLFLKELDTEDLLIKRIKLDLKDDIIYIRNALHFRNTETGEITDDKFTRFITTRVDHKGFTISDVVVSTPTLSVTKDRLMDGSYNLTFKTSDFTMFAGLGKHDSTTWSLTDTDNRPVLVRKEDKTNLVSFTINSKELSSSKNYFIKAVHHTNTGGNSLEGKLKFTLSVKESKLYDITQVGNMILNRLLYFKVIAYTAMYKSVDIIIKDRTGKIVLENLNQKTLTPSVMIENLNLYETYYIYGRITLKNDFKTDYRLISTNILEDNLLVLPKDSITYLGKHDYVQESLFDGQTVQSSSEFYNGAIILSKHDNKSLYRYRMLNGKLVEVGKLVDLETADGTNVGIPYLNILPMHSGNFMVSYCYDNAGIDEAYHALCHYEYNATSNKLKLLNKTVHKEELYGTANTSSAVIDKNDNMYYIPAMIANIAGEATPLALYRFNTKTYLREKVADLPFVAYENVSLAITRDNALIVLGGTDNPGIVRSATDVTTYRTNSNIYKFNIESKEFTKIGDINSLPTTIYAFQTYLRRDGKIVAFNTVRDGNSVGDQRTVVINPNSGNVTVVESDMSDMLVYRNSVVLRSGDILRISNMAIDPQVIYRYVSDTMSAADVDENTTITSMVKDLVVNYNEVITIEEPWLYESITIKGTTPEDTGILRWVSGEETYEYDFRTLIVTRDTIYDSETLNNKGYGNVVTIGQHAMVSKYHEEPNELIVPEGETITIFDPYQYTKIKIMGTSMANTGTLVWIGTSETRYYYYDTLWVTRNDILDAEEVKAHKYSRSIHLDRTSSIFK